MTKGETLEYASKKWQWTGPLSPALHAWCRAGGRCGPL